MSGTRGKVYSADVIVLRRHNLGETDRIVTFFSREFGKIRAVVKGARGPRSKLGGATEPMTNSRVQLAVGQSLDVLTQASVAHSFAGLRNDLERLTLASHCLEIADAGVADRQAMPQLWDLLLLSLAALEVAHCPDLVARAFELRGLAAMGFHPDLDACMDDQASLDTGVAHFHPRRGGLLCEECAQLSPGAIRLTTAEVEQLRWIATASFEAIAGAAWDARARATLARCLIAFARAHLDSPLRSLGVLEEMQS